MRRQRIVLKKQEKKISDSAKERYKNPANVPFYGKHHTEEAKEKLRQARSVPVIQLTIDEIYVARFNSGKEASKQTNINANSISKCCKEKVKTAGGFKWMYEVDYNKLINTEGR